MKAYMWIFGFGFLVSLNSSAMAAGADDFGSRFTGRSPSALEMPSLEQRLQEIAPAAGDTDSQADMPPQPQPVTKETAPAATQEQPVLTRPSLQEKP